MDNHSQPPTGDELTAAAALLEQKRQAAQTYQDARRTQLGNTGTDTGPTDGQTPGGAKPTSTGQAGQSPLGAIIAAMGDTPGKQQINPTLDYHVGCLGRDDSKEDAST
ncbi:hypothetical protein PCASD_17570 [Puccinia coronata f. sp. avenae]|uniref:Uncharacterized protein n=1 Tax=Puccinia coronata f. sp. avenae TaxID=200324 RepID=A0A2N5U5V1_9BASI|nr:hypothetical protein PCASD_17570 [Puccinia coronata f. sp. avenae]